MEELLGSVEAIVHRAFGGSANAPALLLRGANATLWEVGEIEDVVREGKLSDPRLAIEQLHDELVRGRASSTTTECIRDGAHKAVNLKQVSPPCQPKVGPPAWLCAVALTVLCAPCPCGAVALHAERGGTDDGGRPVRQAAAHQS